MSNQHTAKYPNLFARLRANSVDSDESIYRGTPCRCWLGAMDGRKCYGRVNVWQDGRAITRQVHRVMAEIVLGRPLHPETETVQHACDLPWCINYWHFETAGRIDNVKDMQDKRNGRPRRQFKPLLDASLYEIDPFNFTLPVLRIAETASCPF